MEEHLKISICYWHNFCWEGTDAFGNSTRNMPWKSNDDIKQAYNKVDAIFEFISKLDIPYFTFHDLDLIPDNIDIKKFINNLNKITDYIQNKMKKNNIKLLWGTANLTKNPIYQAGAATNPDPDIFAYAATQVKNALEVTKKIKRRKLSSLGWKRRI
jgi:xylose isomerase